MSDRLDEFGPDVQVVMVSFSNREAMSAYQDQSRLRFPIVLVDSTVTYLAFGLGRASTARVWGPKVARRYLDILKAEGLRALRRRSDDSRVPDEDTRQLGGDFVVDADGRLSYGFWSTGPDERPSVDELVTATR